MKEKIFNLISSRFPVARTPFCSFQQPFRNSQVAACPHAAGFAQAVNTKIRSFEDIPEVKGHPLIGTILDYMPWNGFRLGHIFELWKERHEQYGDIFKEKLFSTYMIHCRSPEDTEKLFRSESRTPTRFKMCGMSTVKKWMKLPESMINLEGGDWLKMRQEINHLLKYKMVWKFTRQQQDVCKDMVKYIRHNRGRNGEVPNFRTILDAWALEMSGVFLLNTRLGLLETNVKEEIFDLFHGTKVVMDFVTSRVHGAGIWNFRKHREVRAHAIRSRDIVFNIIKKQKESRQLDGTALGNILKSTSLTETEKLSLIYDVLCGSIETTANAIGLVLYCVTLKEEIQENLRQETICLTSNDSLEGKDVESMRYMGGFLKEVARLYPMAHGHIRTLRQDTVLSGYQIPAGTIVHNTANSTQNKNPKFFPEPDKFMPERWLGANGKPTKFTSTGPFGMGPRACPGRRFAVQEMRLLLIEILKNFKIEYHHRPIVSLFRGTGTASEPPRFSFVPLDHAKRNV